MPRKASEDRGARYASHWTKFENANVLAPTEELEAERERRKKDYVAIAKEYVLSLHLRATTGSAAISTPHQPRKLC